MKKILNKNKFKIVLSFILGAVIFGGIGITANYLLSASDVEYVDKDNNSTTVQNAITDLYSKAKNGGSKLEDLEIGTVSVEGIKITIPYTGDFSTVGCVYGIGETVSYGSIGTISDGSCKIKGNPSTTYHYKLIALDKDGKLYEKTGKATTEDSQMIGSVKLGDYISMTPTLTRYEILGKDTGCISGVNCGTITDGSAQVINPSQLNLWRVISKNSDGTVDVISEYVSPENIYFYGQTGYQNYVGVLNDIAAAYTNEDYVVKTRHFGYNNQVLKVAYTNYLTKKSAPWTVSTGDSGWSSSSENYGAGDIKYSVDSGLVRTALKVLTAYVEGATIDNAGAEYWISSRMYYYRDNLYNGRRWQFSLRYAWGNCSGSEFYSSVISESSEQGALSYNSQFAHVRPILTLDASLILVDGDGETAETAYVLGK